MQLYAFLESSERYIRGIDHIAIIYYAAEEYADAYDIVHKRFPAAQFMRQSVKNPYGDFKKLLNKAVCAHDATHIIFAVDDIVVIDYVDLKRCAYLLKKYRAYGFYLRLGHDITECYTEDCYNKQPKLKRREAGIYSWKFFQGERDWNYPHTVDMTLYAKKDVCKAVKDLLYDSPNTFEQCWVEDIKVTKKSRGLCYTFSQIVNLPLNLVQEDFIENRHASDYGIQFLLEKFEQGFKMDIAALHQFPHKAPHAEYQPTFIPR